jgi:hypothetical protein
MVMMVEFHPTNGNSVVLFFSKGLLVGLNSYERAGEATTDARDFSLEASMNVAFAHQCNGYSWVYVNGKGMKV